MCLVEVERDARISFLSRVEEASLSLIILAWFLGVEGQVLFMISE